MARQGFPSDKQEQFVVRFPEGMRDRVRIEAERNNRSMNAEIIHRLERSFEADMTVKEGGALLADLDLTQATYADSLRRFAQIAEEFRAMASRIEKQNVDAYAVLANPGETTKVSVKRDGKWERRDEKP